MDTLLPFCLALMGLHVLAHAFRLLTRVQLIFAIILISIVIFCLTMI